jgi:hypothetical protein
MTILGSRRKAILKALVFIGNLVGLGRLELPTSPLSGVRSSHLSYRPVNNLQTLDFAGVCSDVDSRSVFGEQQIHEFHEL